MALKRKKLQMGLIYIEKAQQNPSMHAQPVTKHIRTALNRPQSGLYVINPMPCLKKKILILL